MSICDHDLTSFTITRSLQFQPFPFRLSRLFFKQKTSEASIALMKVETFNKQQETKYSQILLLDIPSEGFPVAEVLPANLGANRGPKILEQFNNYPAPLFQARYLQKLTPGTINSQSGGQLSPAESFRNSSGGVKMARSAARKFDKLARGRQGLVKGAYASEEGEEGPFIGHPAGDSEIQAREQTFPRGKACRIRY